MTRRLESALSPGRQKRPQSSVDLGPFLVRTRRFKTGRDFPRMSHLSQLASAMLILIFAAAMWLVGQSYTENRAKVIVRSVGQVVQGR
jgi:hypothetical protein